MMQQPEKLPVWATTHAEIEIPPEQKKAWGWRRLIDTTPESPALSYFNWWQNLIFQWLNYFTNEVATESSATLSAKTIVKPSAIDFIEIKQDIRPDVPAANNLKIYVKQDKDKIYTLDSSNNERIYPLGGAGYCGLAYSITVDIPDDGGLLITLKDLRGNPVSADNVVAMPFKNLSTPTKTDVSIVPYPSSLLIPKTATLGIYDNEVHKMNVYAIKDLRDDGCHVNLAVIVDGSRKDDDVMSSVAFPRMSVDCLTSTGAFTEVGRYLGSLSVTRRVVWGAGTTFYENPYPSENDLTVDQIKTLQRLTTNNGDGRLVATGASIALTTIAGCWSPELRLFCALAKNQSTYYLATSTDGLFWNAVPV